MGEEFKKPRNDSVKVAEKRTKNDRDQVIQKRKKYLKYAICSSFGSTVGFISDNLIEALLLLGLFGAYVLLPD